MRLLFSNTRSLCNKIDLLNAKIYELNIDIIVINESWLTSSIPDNYISKFFKFYRNDRNTRAGGVLIGIKSEYNSIEKSFAKSDFEDKYIEILIRDKKNTNRNTLFSAKI